MEIIEIRTKKSWAGPGLEAYDAEITLWENGDYLYLHYNAFDGEHYTVSKKSIFDYVTGNGEENEEIEFEFDEEYEDLVSAMASNYIDGFVLLHNTVSEMNDITYGHRDSVYSYIVSPIEMEDNTDSDDEEKFLSAEFMYQSKSMKVAMKRKVVVKTPGFGCFTYSLYDDADQLIEFFDDEEAAARSKWQLLYSGMKEKLEQLLF